MEIVFICLGILVVLFLLLIADSVYSNHRFQVVHYDLTKTQNQEDKVKIVFLTDLHGRQYGEKNSKLLEAVQSQNPDVILIGGDMFVKAPDPDVTIALSLVRELVKIAPVFYANGNHEKKVMDYWEESKAAFFLYKKRLEELGVQYLLNDSHTIRVKGRELEVIGLDLSLRDYRKVWHKTELTTDELEDMVPERKNQKTERILLAHNPKYFELYQKLDVNLVLSGHVHGGIMILPILGGVIAPDYRLFPKYDFGKFCEGETTMVLSRGLGVHSIPFRFFNLPELSVIEV